MDPDGYKAFFVDQKNDHPVELFINDSQSNLLNKSLNQEANDFIKVHAETSGCEINILTVPGAMTLTYGTIHANFYLDNSPNCLFSADYTYTVKSKQGFELSLLGFSLIGGSADKMVPNSMSYYDIADNFTEAGTFSKYGGFGIELSASISISNSGNWQSNQIALGFDMLGFDFSIMGGKSYTITRMQSDTFRDWSSFYENK